MPFSQPLKLGEAHFGLLLFLVSVPLCQFYFNLFKIFSIDGECELVLWRNFFSTIELMSEQIFPKVFIFSYNGHL